ncbi:MAG: TlpA disulfide reductase family protein [Myxococcota bacterium]
MRAHCTIALLAALAACNPEGGTSTPGEGGGDSLDISLPDTNGDIISPAAKQSDDVFILAFWATWCQPCQQELTKMSAMYGSMKERGLEIYAVSIDGPDTASQVVPWVEREAYPFPVLLDRETQVLTRYNPRGDIPYYVVLDAKGKVLKDHQGYMSGDMQDLESFLDGVLRAGG